MGILCFVFNILDKDVAANKLIMIELEVPELLAINKIVKIVR